MAPKVCVTKLKKEMKAFLSSPPPHIPAIFVNERNMLEWHFLLEGPPETPYANGWYIGKLRFPPEYPFKPPSIMMLTPSGRFATGTRLCLSMSDFHPESWNPMWTVASILTGLLSFMLESQITTGSLETTDAEKQEFAAKSLSYNLEHPQLKQMFQQELQAAKDTPSQPSSSSRPAQSSEGGFSTTDASGAGQTQASGKETPAAGREQSSEHEATSVEARLAQVNMDSMPADSQGSQAMPAALQEAALASLQQQLKEGYPEIVVTQVEAALRHHAQDVSFCHQLTLLKAQAVARIGDLKAALAVLGTLSESVNTTQSSTVSTEASRLQAAWQTASDYKDRGNELFRKGNLSGAIEQYQQSLAAEPDCAAVHCNMAATLCKLERHAEAGHAAKAALAININYEKAQMRLAQAQQQPR